jgi:phage shock protein PspC (stress-responsive transcriptional regulator)/predicted membrane protein
MDAAPQTGPPVGPPPPPPFGSPRPRQLRRRPDEGPLGGVCAGVAEYFRVDPVIVRIGAVVLALSGPGIIAYVLAWIFVPEAEGPPSGPPAQGDRRDRGAQVFGLLLLAVAASILWGSWWSPARRWFFPIGLIILGAWLVLRRDDGDGAPEGTPESGNPAAPTGDATPAWPGRPDLAATTPANRLGDTTEHGVVDPTATFEATTEAGPGGPGDVGPETSTDAGGGGDAHPPWGAGPWHWSQPPEPPEEVKVARRRRRMVFPIVMGALLVWMGAAAIGGVSVETGLAVALCIVGIGFVFGAFVGGSKVLIVPALLLAAALVTTSVLDIPLEGPIGERSWTPQDISEVEDRYELSMGEGVLDLTEVPLPPGEELQIDASVGLGHLVVIVPAGAALDISAGASAGDTVLLGHSNSGIGVDVDRSFEGDPELGSIDLDLEVGLGQVEVRERRIERRTTTGTTAPGSTSTTLG